MAIFGRAFYRVNDSILSVKDMGIWDRFLRRTEKLGERLDNYLEPTEEEAREIMEELEQAKGRTPLENARNELKEDPFLIGQIFLMVVGCITWAAMFWFWYNYW